MVAAIAGIDKIKTLDNTRYSIQWSNKESSLCGVKEDPFLKKESLESGFEIALR